MELYKSSNLHLFTLLLLTALPLPGGEVMAASDLPGKGVVIQPGQDNIDDENFQTIIVMKALEELGYTVKDGQNAKYPDLHIAIGNGDGKADLAGCVPGWGCEPVIEHQMDAFKLGDTVTHNQGEYSAIIAETITRCKEGTPILYYTWKPYWVSGVLVPGKDVSWVEVPLSAHPNGADAKLANGKNYSFEVMSISVNDISAQNLKMKEKGQGGWDAAVRHADAWIAANRKTFDGWIMAARAAAN